MKKQHCMIGFNDGILMAIGIPLLAFIIPIVFFNCSFNRPPRFTWEKYFTTALFTSTIWLGNRYIMTYSRKKYPTFDDVKKRIRHQSLLMFVFTVVATMVLGFFFEGVFKKDALPISFVEQLIH